MTCKVLNRFGINTTIEQVGDVSVSQLMRGHIKIQCISDFGLIFLCHTQRWGNCVFDALPIHILMQNKERDILASLLLYFLFYYYCAASQLANAQFIDLTSSSGLLYLTFA